MDYKLKVSTIWEVGKRVDKQTGQPSQQDSLFPHHNKANERDRLFVLCDGMGGHAEGNVASSTVCEAISRAVKSLQGSTFTEDDFKDVLSSAYSALDSIYHGDPEAAGRPGTTLTFLYFLDNGCLIAHIGDSRVYHIRPGKTAQDTRILFVTRDHSARNRAIDSGEMTEEEACAAISKNKLARAMVAKDYYKAKAETKFISDIQAGDYFYLCSDGMLEIMSDEQICYQFSELAGGDKVKNLIAATCDNHDNHSAFIIKVEDVDYRPMIGGKQWVEQIDGGDIAADIEADEPVAEIEISGHSHVTSRPSAPKATRPYPQRPAPKQSNKLLPILLTLLVLVAAAVVALIAIGGGDDDKKETELKEEVQTTQGTTSKDVDDEKWYEEPNNNIPSTPSPRRSPKPNPRPVQQPKANTPSTSDGLPSETSPSQDQPQKQIQEKNIDDAF